MTSLSCAGWTMRVWLLDQTAHVPPFAPQADINVPATQVPPEQLPVRHVVPVAQQAIPAPRSRSTATSKGRRLWLRRR